ncbi:MAG: hypothetical protein PHH21_02200 [Candidatus Pacebacteria bacterium]|nr:hypothetical protein [Candidatus Paceibacterota bacterium]
MNKALYWLPRAIAILFILFFFVFSLDVFSEGGTFLDKAGGLLMHNIPTIILILALAFSWRNEKKGGYLFVILGLVFAFYFNAYQRIDTFLMISFPAILAGALFIWSGSKK